jgi:hypothetical protein
MKARTWLLFFASLGACNTDTFDSGDGGDASSDSRDEIPAIGGGDGSTDAKKDSDSSVTPIPRFCDTVDASFCADFDIPNDAGAGFTPVTNGYTVTFESIDASSKPTALEVNVPSNTDGGAAFLEAFVGNNTTTGATSLAVLDFETVIPNLTSNTTYPQFMFAFGDPNGGAQTHFGLSHDSAWWLENLSMNRMMPIVGSVPTNEWVHVKLSIITSKSGAIGQVSIDIKGGTGTAVMGSVETIGTGGSGPPSPWPFDVMIGSSCAQQTNAASLFYDSVIVNLQ